MCLLPCGSRRGSSSAPVGVARVLADHLDSDHRTAPGAPVADRRVPRRCVASVFGITINLISGEYTASSRPIPSRVTLSQAAELQAGTDRGTGMRIPSRLNVRFGPDFVCFTPNSRRKWERGWRSAVDPNRTLPSLRRSRSIDRDVPRIQSLAYRFATPTDCALLFYGRAALNTSIS